MKTSFLVTNLILCNLQQYTFTVEVFDQVDKGSASVTINILDVNDNPPKISDDEFNDFFENNTDVIGIIKNVSRQMAEEEIRCLFDDNYGIVLLTRVIQ